MTPTVTYKPVPQETHKSFIPGLLSIVIPVYNEEKTISIVLDRILDVKLIGKFQCEIILVNDGSGDHSDLSIKEYMTSLPSAPIQYYAHDHNQGKGAAIHTGISHCAGEYIIIQDADLEYDPAEYNTLLKPAIHGHADVVYGSRFSGGNAHRILFFWHSIGNRFFTFVSNVFTNLNLTDMETGYKLFRSDILKQIPLKETRFGFEPEVTAKISKIPGVRIYEVGISYYGRTYQEGKKIGFKDGLRALFCIMKYSIFTTVHVRSIKSSITTDQTSANVVFHSSQNA